MPKLIKGYSELNRPKGRDTRSPDPKLERRQRRLEEIFLEEKDPLRKKERYDALMVHQDENAVANLPRRPEMKYFRDVKTILYPGVNDNLIITHNGEAD